MYIVRIAFFFIINQLIRLGDAVIALWELIRKIFLAFGEKIKQAYIKRQKRKKTAKRQSRILFPKRTSLTTKLKYFLLGTFFSIIFLFIPVLSIIIIQTLPSPTQMSLNLAPQTTKIYDRHGTLLYAIYENQNRTVVALSDIPKYLQDATIAIEDKNFYKDPGFDIPAIIRAAIIDITGGTFQGGSTLTQQLIKSSLLTPTRSITRKLQEIILAFWAERIYSKNQILAMYFNQVPYGGTAWGVEAASQTYFGKSVKDIDLAQAAFLAGMPQAPTTYSPFGIHPTLWKSRQTEVLNRMESLGFITSDQKRQAINEELVFQPQQTPIFAPHFVMYIRDLLEKKYGISLVERGGLNVITSLDLPLQNMAQNTVTQEVSQDNYLNLTNGASLITNPSNGDILAMVGSIDYNNLTNGNFNVTTALRQPGSTMKIVTYSAALAHGFTAATILDDSPVSYKLSDGQIYSPVNYDGRYHGMIPVRTAFANSFNIPAVKTLNTIGVPTFIDLAKKMGITSLQDNGTYGLSVTLGGMDASMLDMATVYGTIANDGSRIDLNPILKVTDNTGTVLEEKTSLHGTQVVDKGISYIVSNILADNSARSLEFGANSPLNIPNYTVSVKTGTSDDKRDNWTIGFTPHLLAAVWVGNNDNSPMSPTLASGITGAAPIWHTIMTNLLHGSPDDKLSIPEDIIEKPCLGHEEYFLKGTENSVHCTVSISPTTTPGQSPKPTSTLTPKPPTTAKKYYYFRW